jgi:hypothetical protein
MTQGYLRGRRSWIRNELYPKNVPYDLEVANENLGAAKVAKDDEFYTQYHDIEIEMNAYLEYNEDVFRGKTVLLPCDDPEWSNFTKYFAQNFGRLGLKKLISTSYAPNSKPKNLDLQPTLFELDSPEYDEEKSIANGKIFTVTRDISGDGVTNFDDLEWNYLEGDGDFRSDEVTALRDEADIIVTNPPFSLFREFLDWIFESEKHFVIIGNMNAITYKESFRLIKADKMWLGASIHSGDREFRIPPASVTRSPSRRTDESGNVFLRVPGVRWFTNLDHGRRHQPIPLMTEAENVKFSKHKEVRGLGYQKYDNYDAIEVPFTDAIPGDYEGVMGVPISFLSKYSPEQFEILGMCENIDLYGLKSKTYSSDECREAYFAKFGKPGTYDLNASGVIVRDGQLEKVYQRILIRHRKASK